jgi:hypothetical protein
VIHPGCSLTADYPAVGGSDLSKTLHTFSFCDWSSSALSVCMPRCKKFQSSVACKGHRSLAVFLSTRASIRPTGQLIILAPHRLSSGSPPLCRISRASLRRPLPMVVAGVLCSSCLHWECKPSTRRLIEFGERPEGRDQFLKP